ncbi:MAG: class II fructose-bisphosphate aldolase [Candidatus Saganbacteria bacterium]|nr:class II fructose-bisphosphate aldolase [Candidatus Saganbacteria bacterium]
MPVRTGHVQSIGISYGSFRETIKGSFDSGTVNSIRESLSLLSGRLGAYPLGDEHFTAVASSPSYNVHSHCAVEMVKTLGLVSPRTDAGPLSNLASHNIYSIMAAGLIQRDRGLVAGDKPFCEQLEGVLNMIELLKGPSSDAPEFKKAKGGVFAHSIDRFIKVSGNSMSFDSPTMVGLDTMLKIAMANGFCIPACNVNNMEMLEAGVVAAALTRSPIIFEWSPGSFKYNGGAVVPSFITRLEPLKAIVAGLGFPYACHLDHGTWDAVIEALNAGFTSVMYDPSETGKKKVSYQDNLRLSTEMAKMAHAKGVAIELELGGKEGSFGDLSAMASAERLGYMTDPEQAVDFVGKTGADVLAISIGNSHGAQKFAGKAFIDIEHVCRIREKLDAAGFKHVPLVFHGGSDRSPFADEIARLIGKPYDKNPSGTPIEFQVRAVKEGRVAKLNLDTIFRLAQAEGVLAMRQVMDSYILKKGTDDFRAHIGVPWRVTLVNEFMRKLVELGAAGQAMTVLRQVCLEKATTEVAKVLTKQKASVLETSTAAGLGADPLDITRLAVKLELRDDQIAGAQTVGNIANVMAAKLAGSEQEGQESKAGKDLE